MMCRKAWEFVASSERNETCLVLSSKAVNFTCLQSCECKLLYLCFLSFRYYPYRHHEFIRHRPAPRSKRKRRQLQLPDGASVSVKSYFLQIDPTLSTYKSSKALMQFRLVSVADTAIFRDGLRSALFRWRTQPYSATGYVPPCFGGGHNHIQGRKLHGPNHTAIRCQFCHARTFISWSLFLCCKANASV
jgi:hypothetical protein